MSQRFLDAALAMRRAFDGSFADAPTPALELEDLLAIRVGGEAYALRLSEVAGLHVDRKVIPLPGGRGELLGVAGLRGRLTAVYDLRALLGTPGAGAPRWLITAKAAQPVGLAFDSFEAHLRVPRSALLDSNHSARPHVRGAVEVAGAFRPLIDMTSVLARISTR